MRLSEVEKTKQKKSKMKNKTMKHQNTHRDARRRAIKSIYLTCLLAAMMAASGCTTYRPITGAASPQLTSDLMAQSIKAGDTVKIVTKDGRDLKFKVEQVGTESISGENQSVSFQEIAKLEKRKVSAGKTTALGLGMAATVAVILGAIVVAAGAAALAGGM